MERGLWKSVMQALRRVPRRSPARATYNNRQVLAVLLWAALHDRPVSWACRRSSWPVSAWRRRLPDQSTMSRRLRDPRLIDELDAVIRLLQRTIPAGSSLIADGKPLPVSKFTGDPEAAMGWGAGRFSHGYKLHVIIDDAHRLIAWALRPMNEAECVVAAQMIERTPHEMPRGSLLLADASYDSNPLHAAASASGLRLLAPRRRTDRPLCRNRRHHPGRLGSVEQLERDGPLASVHRRVRPSVERFFGSLASWGGGLWGLPSWARRTHRVTLWVGAKLVLDAARRARKTALAA